MPTSINSRGSAPRMPMPPAITALVAEYEGHLASGAVEARAQRRHLARIAVALATCLALLAWNLLLGDVGRIGVYDRDVLLGLTLLCSVLCTWSVSYQSRAELARLKAAPASLAGRAAVVHGHHDRRGWLLFVLALAGQGVAALATLSGVRLVDTRSGIPLSLDSLILLVDLMPTALLVVAGWRELPTRERLVATYRLILLYQVRQRLIVAREQDGG